MTRWEYYYVTIGWPGGSGGNFIAYIDHLGVKGPVKSDTLDTKISKSKYSVDALGRALAKLGEEGWELVKSSIRN